MIIARYYLGEIMEWTLLDPIESKHPYDGGEAMAREIEERLKAAVGDELWDMLSNCQNSRLNATR